MFKRLFLIGALCISLMALSGTDANAFPPSVWWGGWSHNGIIADSTWKGCANTDNEPTDIVITLTLEDVELWWANPADNTGGVASSNFHLRQVISKYETIDPSSLEGAGKYKSKIEFEDSDLISAIPEEILDLYRPNPKWYPYDIEVWTFYAVVQGFTDIDGRCEEDCGVVHGYECPDDSCRVIIHDQ